MKNTNYNHRVTIVMTIRERYSLTIHALKSILENTDPIYRLIFVDCQSPLWIRKQLDILVEQHGIEVLRIEEPLWPNQARIKAMERISSQYTVFIDNDIQVKPGWLKYLIACADETGAGMVGPLYLWGDGRSQPKIHMAGGKLTISSTKKNDLLSMEEKHQLVNQRPEDVREQLYRKPCDFLEYHCMLVRTHLLKDHTLLDDEIVCVHEHIDTALTVRQLGYAIYLEPASCVNYLAFADLLLDDLSIFKRRWSLESGEESLQKFAVKWRVNDDPKSFGDVRSFLSNHVRRVNPLRVNTPARSDWNIAMGKEELGQTRSDLLDVAVKRGYQPEELLILSHAYVIAQVFTDGGYRSCGRPFINHLAGTASVLLRYDFCIEIVAAGLLHAAYSHCPIHPEGDQAMIDEVCRKLGGKDHKIERLVRAYTLRGMRSSESKTGALDAGRLTLFDAEVEMLALANEIDMNLSGENRYSAPRNDEMSVEQLIIADRISDIIGVPGMADTLKQWRNHQQLSPLSNLLTPQNMSYRFNAEHSAITPMPSNAKYLLKRE